MDLATVNAAILLWEMQISPCWWNIKSLKHKKCFDVAKSSVNITQFLEKKKSTDSEQTAKSELIIAGYFAEHNIPFANIDHLLKICKRAFPDSKIAEKLSMKRTKLTYVIQDNNIL